MKQDVKSEWVKRLRDGRPQTVGALLREKDDVMVAAGQCCLGVLCEIAKEEGVVEVYRHLDGSFLGYGKPGMNYNDISHGHGYITNGTLPDEVKDWAGLPSTNPRAGHRGRLAGLNDHGKTFYEIADIIENEELL